MPPITRRIHIVLPIAVAAALAASAFADTKQYAETGFTAVSASAGVNVTLKQGAFSVTATGSEKALRRLEIEKRGDALHVGRKSSSGFNWGASDRVEVVVTAPSLSAISASSGSDVSGKGLQYGALNVSVSSGADVELSGSCRDISVSVSSGSDFEGRDLKCETATISASSGADAEVYASRSATASASSGADIDVAGNPPSLTEDESSGGSIEKS